MVLKAPLQRLTITYCGFSRAIDVISLMKEASQAVRSPTEGTPPVTPSPACRSSAGVTVAMGRGYSDYHPALGL
jgi:hypothetical protein